MQKNAFFFLENLHSWHKFYMYLNSAQTVHISELSWCTHIDAHKGCILMHTQTGGRESVPAAARLSVTHMVRINH